ncbi:MAG: hypothetical protein HFI57_10740 [Lachnospiraceae bacterium]|mgnify:CR=1 FL=1|nr:hypothetical protein [Lachnospiraceae bacterium]
MWGNIRENIIDHIIDHSRGNVETGMKMPGTVEKLKRSRGMGNPGN